MWASLVVCTAGSVGIFGIDTRENGITLRFFSSKEFSYLKDIETLVLNIAMPKGNRARGRLPRSANLTRALWEVLKEHQRKIRGLRKALR